MKPKPEELSRILVKQFLKKSEIEKLVEELPGSVRKQLIEETFIEVEKLAAERGKRLACAKYLPASLVFEHLAQYGITKKALREKIRGSDK